MIGITIVCIPFVSSALAGSPDLRLLDEPGLTVVVDATGDLWLETEAGTRTELGQASDRYPYVDIVEATLAERANDTVEVSIQLLDWNIPRIPGTDQGYNQRYYLVNFEFGGVQYSTDWRGCEQDGTVFPDHMELLSRATPASRWQTHGCFHFIVVEESNQFVSHLPSSMLHAADGSGFGAGDALIGFHVIAYERPVGRDYGSDAEGLDRMEDGLAGLAPDVHIVDRAPDTGFGDALRWSGGEPAEPSPPVASSADALPGESSQMEDARGETPSTPGISFAFVALVVLWSVTRIGPLRRR